MRPYIIYGGIFSILLNFTSFGQHIVFAAEGSSGLSAMDIDSAPMACAASPMAGTKHLHDDGEESRRKRAKTEAGSAAVSSSNSAGDEKEDEGQAPILVERSRIAAVTQPPS